MRKSILKKWKEIRKIMVSYKKNNIKENCLIEEFHKNFKFWSKLLHGWVQEAHWKPFVRNFIVIFFIIYTNY